MTCKWWEWWVFAGLAFVCGAGFGLFAGKNEGRRFERATMFKPQQLVRVYNDEAKLLFVGEFAGQSEEWVTLCAITWKAGGPPFKPHQCLVVSARRFVLADAREPGVVWRSE